MGPAVTGFNFKSIEVVTLIIMHAFTVELTGFTLTVSHIIVFLVGEPFAV